MTFEQVTVMQQMQEEIERISGEKVVAMIAETNDYHGALHEQFQWRVEAAQSLEAKNFQAVEDFEGLKQALVDLHSKHVG